MLNNNEDIAAIYMITLKIRHMELRNVRVFNCL